ncbi:MAG: hypothetical protein ABGY24_18535, partial [bacterium]
TLVRCKSATFRWDCSTRTSSTTRQCDFHLSVRFDLPSSFSVLISLFVVIRPRLCREKDEAVKKFEFATTKIPSNCCSPLTCFALVPPVELNNREAMPPKKGKSVGGARRSTSSRPAASQKKSASHKAASKAAANKVARKSVAKKPVAKSPKAKATSAKKTAAKPAVKATPTKSAGAKKTPVKKAPAKKAPVKKAPAKKTPAKKAPAKKTVSTKRSTSRKPSQTTVAAVQEQRPGLIQQLFGFLKFW